MSVSLRKPVCFVLTPFGVKIHPDSGASVDFDAIYQSTLRPALHSAGLDPVRMDQDMAGLKEVQQRVMEAELAVADVTTRDPAILFLLGSRAQRLPDTTLVLAARGSEMQLSNLSSIEVIVYDLDEGNRLSTRESIRLRKVLSAALSKMRETIKPASPQEPITRGVVVAQAIEAALDKRDAEALRSLEAEVVHEGMDSSLLINIFQAYGRLGEWQAMIDLFHKLPQEMQMMPRLQQQTGLALNRVGQREPAVAMLTGLLAAQGPDSETFGLLGRVFKDQWFESKDPALLDRAIESYMKGFETNRKDAYPAINAVTLLELKGDPDSQQTKQRLLPLVRAAVQDQIKYSRQPNYWDYATLLELAVLGGNEGEARVCVADARRSHPDDWQTETTANNLELIRQARIARGQSEPWLDQILGELHQSVSA